MCGIAGIVSARPGHAAQVAVMIERLKHRGPDGHGIKGFSDCTLGHTRLSIIDLDTGQQPMADASGNVAVTFNGEIYNYKELRRLIKYPYKTSSDTEVLLAAYRQYGAGFLGRIKGMFAIALWDEEKRQLILARDRFGEKPLFFATGRGGELVFASEIKAIVASGLVDTSTSQPAMMHYMQYLTTPVGRTVFDNIHELLPGRQLVWLDGRITQSVYWDLPEPGPALSMQEAAEEFTHLFRLAVRRQMVADVEVGAFLSGGLDSTTVCLEAVKLNPALQTISYGFSGQYSELPYAREVANQLQTRHHELEDDVGIAELLLAMNEVFDEPFADSSNIPMFRICQFASRHMKVVLSGDGADELLGGYDGWYKPLAIRESNPWLFSSPQVSRLSLLGIKAARKLLPALAPQWQHWRSILQIDQGEDLLSTHYRQRQYFSDNEIAALFGNAPMISKPAGNNLDQVLRADIADYMPSDILKKVDRTAMANGLEVRAPFLDADLASFLIALPVSLKVNAAEDKRLLRHAYAAQWPPTIRQRPKTGFGAPVHEWLRRPDVMALRHSLLGSPAARVYRFIDPAVAGRYIHHDSYQAWILLVLAIWAEKNG